MREHHKDQDVCATSLNLLIGLVPHLAESEGGCNSTLRECRDAVLQMSKAFW